MSNLKVPLESNLIDWIINNRDINQKDLAKMCGISTVHMCNVYNGNKKASKTLTNLLKLIYKFPASASVLKDDDDEDNIDDYNSN